MIVDFEKKLMVVQDGKHSAWGPSGAKKWIHCAGSINAAKAYPKKSNIYANSGTAAHAVSEYCRLHDVKAELFKNWTIRVSRSEGVDDILCDQRMVDSVQEFIDYCDQVPAEMVLVEQLLPYAEYVPGGFGTLDDARLNDDLCVITDFKDGQGVQVFAEENEQLKLQALGVYLKYRAFFAFSKFILRIAQPRLGHFDEWEITLLALLAWAKDIIVPAYKATLDPNAPRAAGAWCTEGFCPARFDCPTRAKAMIGHLVGEFEDLDAGTTALKEADTNTDKLSSADLARCLSVLDQIKAWAKDLEAHALRETAAGRPPQEPGKLPWKFVESRSKRIYIVPEDVVIERVEDECDIPSNELYKKKLISPKQLEGKIGKKHPIMTECVKKPPGKPKLVPGEDKRPSMAAALINTFADLGEEKEDDDE